jgi:hypothetical protein
VRTRNHKNTEQPEDGVLLSSKKKPAAMERSMAHFVHYVEYINLATLPSSGESKPSLSFLLSKRVEQNPDVLLSVFCAQSAPSATYELCGSDLPKWSIRP